MARSRRGRHPPEAPRSLRFIGLVGIVPLLTALVGSGPMYTLFSFSTCPTKKDV
jgi:hypothetical protein